MIANPPTPGGCNFWQVAAAKLRETKGGCFMRPAATWGVTILLAYFFVANRPGVLPIFALLGAEVAWFISGATYGFLRHPEKWRSLGEKNAEVERRMAWSMIRLYTVSVLLLCAALYFTPVRYRFFRAAIEIPAILVCEGSVIVCILCLLWRKPPPA